MEAESIYQSFKTVARSNFVTVVSKAINQVQEIDFFNFSTESEHGTLSYRAKSGMIETIGKLSNILRDPDYSQLHIHFMDKSCLVITSENDLLSLKAMDDKDDIVLRRIMT